jgi:hypothetical protein
MLAAVENCEMLGLDALEGEAPEVLIVLGTRTATIDMDGFYRGLEAVRRALRTYRGQPVYGLDIGADAAPADLWRRRRSCRGVELWWPRAAYASLLEFTTGYGPRSGGLRRPHWNLLLKGVPAADVQRATAIAAGVWCEHVDAEVAAQHGTAVYSYGGLTRYLALHFQKASQAPPEGFRGQRFNCSRDYFTGCSRAVARARARESLALKREVWKQTRRDDVDAPQSAHDVELNAQLAHRLALRTRWVLASETGSPLGPMSFPLPMLDGAEMVDRGDGSMVERWVHRKGFSGLDYATARERVAAGLAVERDVATPELRSADWLPDRELSLFTWGNLG